MELSIFKDQERHSAGPRCQLGMQKQPRLKVTPSLQEQREPWSCLSPGVPNLCGTRDWFVEDNFSTDWVGRGRG